jgi:beta-galactofuranoside beta-1,5-galactofuranosyltransferase
VQPIAVSKVILRPVLRSRGPGEEVTWDYSARLEVLEDAMINDVAFLDRDVTGQEAELSANVCPLHTVTVIPSRKPKRYTEGELVIAVAMTVEEIPNMLLHWTYWARNSSVGVYILLPTSQSDRVSEAEALLKTGLATTRVKVEAAVDTAEPGNLALRLVEQMRTAAYSTTQWFLILSPATFITSMDDLLLALEPHDATQRMYMGGMTESKGLRDKFGQFAYGGAGIVLSRPLVEDLSSHSIISHTSWLI